MSSRLLVHDPSHSTYPSEDFARLANQTNKDVTLKLWENLYHEIHNEAEQAEVFKVMIEWLDQHV